ncbi:MAG: nuclear transport factor 2 family protein [Tepidiformaceae bacterium]
MTAATEPMLALAERFFAAIEAGDLETIRSIYAPDARVWHNFDGIEQTVEENLRVLKWMVRAVPGRRYDEVRRQVTPGGWVQQHVLRGTAPNGQPFEMPACIVFTVAAGRVTRVDEYLDSAHAAVLRG